MRRYVYATQGSNANPSLQLECLGNNVAKLLLCEYNMLCNFPLLIAAFAVSLAKFILQPTKRPWGVMSFSVLVKKSGSLQMRAWSHLGRHIISRERWIILMRRRIR